MSARNIRRGATITGYANAANAPIYVDSDDNKLKMIPAGSGTTEVDVVDVSSTQTLTNKTLTSPTINNPTLSKSYTYQFGGQDAKVGAAAGWTLGAADNLPYLATMAAAQTNGTLIIPISGLQIGATITGFKVIAQIESAGNTATIDGDLRAVTNAAAEPTDASIATMVQVSVTADTAVAQAKTALTEVVTSGKTYYLKLTATTAAATDIILQMCEVTVTEV